MFGPQPVGLSLMTGVAKGAFNSVMGAVERGHETAMCTTVSSSNTRMLCANYAKPPSFSYQTMATQPFSSIMTWLAIGLVLGSLTAVLAAKSGEDKCDICKNIAKKFGEVCVLRFWQDDRAQSCSRPSRASTRQEPPTLAAGTQHGKNVHWARMLQGELASELHV